MAAAAVVLAAFAPAAQELPSILPPPEDLCSVAGRVVHKATGDPVPGAKLTLGALLEERTVFTAETDQSGRFEFALVPAGLYRLSVTKDGFIPRQYRAPGLMFSGIALRLTLGQAIKDLVIDLVPYSTVSGAVRDQTGRGLAGARVQLLGWRYVNGRHELVAVSGTGTNSNGEYRLGGVQPGRYYLAAAGRPAGSDTPVQMGPIPTFYPNATEISRATPVVIEPGAKPDGLEIRLAMARLFSVRGVTVDAGTGKPLRDLVVTLGPADSGTPFQLAVKATAVGGDEGAFEFHGVPPGSYRLTATGSGKSGAEKRRSGVRSLEVGDSDVEGVVLRIFPAVNLDGTVRVESERRFDLRGARVALIPEEAARVPSAVAEVGEGSRFRFEAVAPAKYNLALYGLPDELYLKSARFGKSDVLSASLDLTGGSVPSVLEITVSDAGGAVTGTVMDQGGQPAMSALVTLFPEPDDPARQGLFKGVWTEVDGSFEFLGVAPGEYRVFAWEILEPGAYQNPDFLEEFKDRGISVSVRERQTSNVELELIPAQAPDRSN